MARNPDYKELLQLLKDKKVEFLVIGGHAVTFYSRLKLTEDLDIWVNPTEQNAKKVFKVLTQFGYGNLNLEVLDFIKKDSVVQIGYPPVRIDFMTTVEGLNFEESYKRKKHGYLFGVKGVPFLWIDDLIKNKKLANRPKDKFDVSWIKKYFNPKKIK
jgi:predicted nucleotidyltransferase